MTATISGDLRGGAGLLGPRAGAAAPAASEAGSRIAALDGLRGVLAMMVVVSHYFGSVPSGVAGLTLGWIAVKMFFVLSGFLVAKIILEHGRAANFFTVFYVRRACRTLPAYFLVLSVAFGAMLVLGANGWMADQRFMPLWSYLTFSQGFVMTARGDFGSEWLLPTWTLTVEEQFYLIAPLICLLAPRRWLLGVLIAGVIVSIGFRAVVYWPGLLSPMTRMVAGMVTLPSVCHAMFIGMIGALLLRMGRIEGERIDLALRVAPLPLLVVAMGLKAIDVRDAYLFEVIGHPLVALACVSYLLAIVRGAPEADSLRSPMLRQLGRMSFSLYLLHNPVLWLLHGVLLGGHPDIGTLPKLAVTVLAVAVSIAVSWAAAKWIEEPMIAYGKTWKWRHG